ncbi:hsp70 nucleotide exchange factor fes1 [Recurvomyces mirabilis]|uniref:Hsp70 nucleotide exchange factor fes1 n=1 Tax=Recurvomyces mirabilis TaxID=574656 RepID=A0AAE1BYL5_9PEZI|nr:hsp70 nucleotide exchange factor fes1 [Recurvomyces mirabilis]
MADGTQSSLNGLLKWGIENSAATRDDPNAPTENGSRDPTRGLDSKMLAELLGGPSDADRMREAMSAIVAPVDQIDLDNKMIAWDNFEQLIENLDNANNMEPLGLWAPLVQQLENSEPEMRRMAAWCCSTAVQNNIKSQEKMLAVGGIPKLAGLATGDENAAVKKKAISALSSAVRNFQPALDELEKCLSDSVWKRKGLEAGDMESVDELIGKLREGVSAGR